MNPPLFPEPGNMMWVWPITISDPGVTIFLVSQDDPIIEYEDEFGRIRTARRSEVPRHLLPTSKDQEIEDE